MKKLVNGKIVDIKNIALFEQAMEGLAIRNTTMSKTSDGLNGSIDTSAVKRYIKQYDIFFKYMPYPLYAVESDVKYATLGNFIKSLSKEELDIWVRNGLSIRIDKTTGMTLKIVNNTWSIIYDTKEHKDNTAMNNFSNLTGYKEYNWILNKVLNKESTSDFYKVFMPEFVAACNDNQIILKWELENMLTFGQIPQRRAFKANRLIDVDDNKEYFIDIYSDGTIEATDGRSVYTINFTTKEPTSSVRKRQEKAYNFDAYVKDLDENGSEKSKMSKTRMIGLMTMFIELCGYKNAKELKEFPTYYGAISGGYLVLNIEGRLIVFSKDRQSEPKLVASGIELYTVENNKVYFTRSKGVTDSIAKDTLYSYNLKDGITRICKIIYSY